MFKDTFLGIRRGKKSTRAEGVPVQEKYNIFSWRGHVRSSQPAGVLLWSLSSAGQLWKNGAPKCAHHAPGPWHPLAPPASSAQGQQPRPALHCCTAVLAADKTTHAQVLATSEKVLRWILNWISHWIFHTCTHKACWWFREILLIWQTFPPPSNPVLSSLF